MPNTMEPQDPVAEARYAIAVSRYNEMVTSRLLEGAVGALRERGVPDDAIDVAWTPGAWELPLVASEMAKSGRYVAVLCLGAVIRGETTHDQYINQQVSATLGEMAIAHSLPVLFGVLTCNTLDQALNRAGGTVGNKGAECAEAALEMVGLMRALRSD